ncbi:MAG: site-2 protease family protein [Oscillospiraceae bacterium]|nr:site-2 protease family protein [Oscillospiraceae bacterium]
MNGPIFELFDFLRNPNSTANEGISVILMLFAITASTLILLPFHESAHALSAKLLGDNTAERMGRLTLNPLRHIDPIGFSCMFLIGFGWAKPVPVNPLNADRRVTQRGFLALTAAAGPVSNVLFSLICIIIAKVLYIATIPKEIMESLADVSGIHGKFEWLVFGGMRSGDGTFTKFTEMLNSPFVAYLGFALMLIATISLYLAAFNLLPIPPLDGSKILFFFLNNRQVNMFERHINIIRGVLLLLLLATPFLRSFIGLIADFLMKGLELATFFIR